MQHFKLKSCAFALGALLATIPVIGYAAQNESTSIPPFVSTSTTGTMKPLGEWSVQIESMRVARDKQVEIVAAYKNTTRRRVLLTGGEIDMVLTDGDGVGIRPLGNLYQAGGDPDIEPERITSQLPVEPGGMEKVMLLFDIPLGNVPFKTLTVFGRNSKPLVFNASNLPLPEPVAPVAVPVQGTTGGDGNFVDIGDFSLRFDGVRRGRNNALQMFVTIKNIDPHKQRWLAHPAYSLGVSVLTDTGAEIRGQGNIFRASGTSIDLAPIKETMVLVPDGQATVCYPVSLPKGAFASQLLLKFKGQTLTYNLPQLP